MERLEGEIKELSYGLKGKREDAAKHGQRKVWESYQEVSSIGCSDKLVHANLFSLHAVVCKGSFGPFPRSARAHRHDARIGSCRRKDTRRCPAGEGSQHRGRRSKELGRFGWRLEDLG